MKNNVYQELKKVIKNAHAPYSRFYVSAMVETDKGNFYGVNVENAAYPSSMCAERVAIHNAISHGAKKFQALYLLTSSNTFITPCGACRQVMNEFLKASTPIYVFNNKGAQKKYTLSTLLPNAINYTQLIKATHGSK
ncbi:MAG: cytidine deaminase [Mycoplasmataceae bacterium]|jgi:cytidine deaminase|nr:cytidine deaminase [Mycoplasmataceae bacterium]